MYVDRIKNQKGVVVTLLRKSIREGKKVRKETIANLSIFDDETINLIEGRLKGRNYVEIGEAFTCVGAKSHGAVSAVKQMMKKLDIGRLIASQRSPERDRIEALIAGQLLFSKSKLGIVSSMDSTTLPEEFGVEGVDEDDFYAAMDWLSSRKDRIEKKLVSRHMKQGELVLFDSSSSYVEGAKCPLAAFGHNRDKKKGKKQINYSLTSDKRGCPLMIEVYPGNTSDSKMLLPMLEKLRKSYGLTELVVVADRGMITHDNVKEISSIDGVNWISALRKDTIKKLVNQRNFQLGLFDERNLFEFYSEDYPGERLIACRNESLKNSLAAKRESLLVGTEKELNQVVKKLTAPKKPLVTQEEIGIAVGQVINKYKVKKYFILNIQEGHFSFERNEKKIQEDSVLDGIYVIRSSISSEDLDAPSCVRAYKNLSELEKAFEALKSVDLRVRPINHRLEDRVRMHFFICMLACYVEWHLRQAWAELTFTDQEKDSQRDPVEPAKRSKSAKKKDSAKYNENGLRVRDFRSVLDDLASLPKNTYRIGSGKNEREIKKPAEMTPLQMRAMELIQELNVSSN
jgi:transposase